MGHCVGRAGYARDIARGELYAYRMLQPERLTIMLRRTRRGWDISEVKGPQNREPGAESIKLIREWLSSKSADAGTLRAVPLSEL